MGVLSKSAIKAVLALVIAPTFILGISVFEPPSIASARTQPRSGAAVFAQNCARCHGADGRAQTKKGRVVGATDLTSSDWVPDTARDIRIVTRGKEDMPSFRGRLKPAEIEAVVSYIRRFKR